MRFYLGIHNVKWLEDTDVPCFVSYGGIGGRKRLQDVKCRWVLDSGGFTQLRKYGRWTFTPEAYAREVLYLDALWPGLDWVAPMDWMCEPSQVAKTGLNVEEHQRRTLVNFIKLRALLGDLVVPVLQGWELQEYERHVAMYYNAGIHLGEERIVGLGSICRRNQDSEIGAVMSAMAAHGLRLHGFGVRGSALIANAHRLASADSMAWSMAGKYDRLPGHELRHKNCANCLEYGLVWRENLLSRIPQEELCSI